MKKKKDSKINIGNVKGDVVISQNQNGGITSHETSTNTEKQKIKSIFNNKYVLAIGLIAAILGILGYFGLRPSNENKENHSKINTTMEKRKSDSNEKKLISIGEVKGDVVISQNQTGGITAHSVKINEAQKPEWSMGKPEKIGENEWRTIFSAREYGNMAYYNWNVLFTLNTEVIKREDVPGEVSVGPWMPLSVQGGNLSKNQFFIGFSEFKPRQYFSIYLYSKEPIKVLRTDVLSEKNNAP